MHRRTASISFYKNFNQEDLADLLTAYDHYIANAADARAFDTGWTPVCVEEFYDNEYQNVWKAGHDFSDFFFEASEMTATEISAHSLALAIDELYYQFDTYNYKDEIDDRAEAVASLETDILEGKTEELKEYLKNEMLSYGETDSFSMAAKLIIAQMERYEKLQKNTQKSSEEAPIRQPDWIEISCYADQVLPRTDRAELVDAYQDAQFTVPRVWAEKQAKEMGFRVLEEFLSSYTWDDTIGWFEQAFHDGVLLDVSLSQNREVVKSFLPINSNLLTLDEKLSSAKETVQNEQSQHLQRNSGKTILVQHDFEM